MNDPKIKKEEEEKKLVPYGLLGGRTAAFGILKGTLKMHQILRSCFFHRKNKVFLR